ncbi:MAG: serine/threonine protein kinase [Gemmataceae bacterium]|nr:serine/threonine protein kinase [Gemmataceae bacterium]MCI0738388.1 serine/threonine protein kinase [Gemmataceae bacterium]
MQPDRPPPDDESLAERFSPPNKQPTLASAQSYPAHDEDLFSPTAAWTPTVAGDTQPSNPAVQDPARALQFKFGPYLVLDVLGRGGMGIVYRARDTVLGREVALKMIHGGHLAKPSYLERFYREAQAVAQLKHRHVVQLFDYGVIDHQHYFTMGLAEGGSLFKQLDRFQRDQRVAVALMEKVARALQHVHGQGLLHRDMKPGNILLDRGDEPLISDFGLAKFFAEEQELTRSGDAVGTPSYMAPEQASGRNELVSAQTDVWALGVILYELLLGMRPFNGNTREEITRAIREDETPPPRKLQPKLDRNLETILLKCLEKSPGKRYASAGALADDLGAWLRGEPIRARPPGVFERARRALKKHPFLAAFGALLVLTPATLLIIRERFDPDRELRIIQRQQARNEPITLIEVGEDPRWHRWQLRGDFVSAKTAGVFAMKSTAYALLELLPETKWECYRFSAEVRHESTNLIGGTGIYFAHSLQPRLQYKFHAFLAFHFADWGQLVSDGNCKARLEQYLLHQAETELPVQQTDLRFKKSYPAAESLGKQMWRTLAVDVDTTEIRVFFDSDWVGSCARTRLQEVERVFGRWGPMIGIPPRFPVHGGLGLFMKKGEASFRNVKLDPLP